MTHDTDNAYSLDCRCERCCDAHDGTNLRREWDYKAINYVEAPGIPPAQHGTYACYAHGCRCDDCRQASAAYGRLRRARKRDAAKGES